MEFTYSSKKAKFLKMQANYLRYLATIYPSPTSQSDFIHYSQIYSLSPQRVLKDTNPYDNIPIKRVQKKFEEMLEEQLQKNPSLSLIEEKPNLNSLNPKFLKRGEGHLSTYTRSQSSSQLESLRKSLSRNDSSEKAIDLAKIHIIKEQLTKKNFDMKKEDREIPYVGKIQYEESKNMRNDMDERKICPQREEADQLKKIIIRMQNHEKIKELKYQEELRKLNIDVLNLRQQVAELERKTKLNKTCSGFHSIVRINKLHVTPTKRNGDYQGKIQKFVEKRNLSSDRKIRKENYSFDQYECLSFD